MMKPCNIILVCGGRGYDGREHVFEVLNELNRTRGPIVGLIHGACQDWDGYLIGADRWADEWQYARIQTERRLKTDLGLRLWCAGYPAQWMTYGRAAGPIRNKHMLDQHPGITLVVPFPGGSGTANMVKQAKGRHIEVLALHDPTLLSA